MTVHPLTRVASLALAASVAASCAHASDPSRAAPAGALGRHEVYTVPINPALVLRTATYTPSGKVLVTYSRQNDEDPRQVNLATMDDDGRNLRPFFSQRLPDRPKDNGIRYMVFPDNQRVFLGDFVLECATSLETCQNPKLLPVEYPAEVADGAHISHRWSEMIVAPDNRHIAWTTLLSNYSALVFLGELRKDGARYLIDRPRIISTLAGFDKDPNHPDGVLPRTIRGGEVKQFIRGGTALSVVGAVKRDIPDSIEQDIATGALEPITDTPGYTETTIFSPDERLGIVMTTRFSERTDPAVLGLIPRPYPASLNMGLSMVAYTYAVTGVRRVRPGNIGPVLVEIAASKANGGYMGVDLSSKDEWVYYSPMSWHPSSTRAMWMEGRRGTDQMRMRVVRLADYQAAPAVTALPVPQSIPYAIADLSIVQGQLDASQNMDVKVHGRGSGHILYRRTPSSIDKTYVNFSEDGRSVYSGRETMLVNPGGQSTYTADVRLAGPKPGTMALKMTFGPLGGEMPARLIFDRDASGKPLSFGYAEYDGRRLEVSALHP